MPSNDAGGGGFKVINRQRQQMAKGPTGQVHVDLVGGRQGQDLPQEAEGRIKYQSKQNTHCQDP